MPIHIETPLIDSLYFSRKTAKRVLLKMDALQPCGSFKARGIGHACTIYKERGAKRFLSSSGGNAGLAAAYSGRMLGVPVTVVVPESTTERAKELIAREGAEVIVTGESWAEANAHAQSLLNDETAFIHPFDDPLIWEGHASLIDEIAATGEKPDAIVVSVGGGGLFIGVVEGLRRNGWEDVPVVAVETDGAQSLNAAIAAGDHVELPAIASIATTLGAKKVAARAYELAKEHPTESLVVTDGEAVGGCFTLLDEHRLVVEPACGASVAALSKSSETLAKADNILVIVCGGAGATVRQLGIWRSKFE